MSEPTDYDLVPYSSHPYPQTHPDHLGALATLFGMRPAPSGSCRVLELGCSSGGNLLPLATEAPGSRFVGVDLAPTAIEQARATADELGLDNVDLRVGSIEDVDVGWGVFDYVICHGLYSWVPEPVREAILRVCKQNLAPQGVAFVSYNTYPCWHLRGLGREIMMFHVRNMKDPATRVQQGRAILDFVASQIPADSEYGTVIRNEADRVRKLTDWYLFHDNLAPENTPFWFQEFSRRATGAGLQYLGESAFSTMIVGNFGADVQEVLAQCQGDILATEQYMDFLRNRAFRQTLLCHEDVVLDRDVDWPVLERFELISRARPDEEGADLATSDKLAFRTPDAIELSTDEPLAKAALMALHDARPAALSFDAVVQEAIRRLAGDGPHEPEAVADARALIGASLFRCFANDVVHPRVRYSPVVGTVTERPVAWPYARAQARRRSRYLTNLRHQSMDVDELDRHLVPLLDGSRDVDALVDAMFAKVKAGDLEVRKAEGPYEDDEELRTELRRAIELALAALARSGLLIG